jgi:hypothetical protein
MISWFVGMVGSFWGMGMGYGLWVMMRRTFLALLGFAVLEVLVYIDDLVRK